jgi:glycosyltransferase involved in cell wall biosynthesis
LGDVGLSTSDRGKSHFRLVQCCVELDQAQVCYLAYLDPCLSSIALAKPGSFQAKLAGTLFKPLLHYRTFPMHRAKKWAPQPKAWVRAYLVALLASHRSFVSEILTLDPLAPLFYNKITRTSKFRHLPDYALTLNSPLFSREHFDLPHNRIIFLLAGGISNYKGIREFIAALRLAFAENATFRRRATIVLAGRVLESRELVYDAVSDFNKSYSDASILLFDRRLTDEEFISLISICDVVCIPYIQFVGMSSLLAHAAAYERPVVGPEYGLLGELIQRYDLGVTCDTTNPELLKAALLQFTTDRAIMTQERQEALRAFGAGRSLERFGKEICDSILRASQQSQH